MKIKRWGLQGFLILVCAFSFCEVASAIQTVKTFETGTFTGTNTFWVSACFTGTFLYTTGDEDIIGLDYSGATPSGFPGTVALTCFPDTPTKTTISGTFSTTDGKVVGEIHGNCTHPDWSFGCDFGDVVV